MPQVTFCCTKLDCEPPTAAEVVKAVGRLEAVKAPGICGIPAQLLKAGRVHMVWWLTQVFQTVWKTGQMPSNWKKGTILPLYKDRTAGESAGSTAESPCCLPQVKPLPLLSLHGSTQSYWKCGAPSVTILSVVK